MTWAIITNTIIPGIGFNVINKNKPAFVYLTSEALFGTLGFTYLGKYSNYNWASKQYAVDYAGIKKKDANDYYWDIIGDERFPDSDIYNSTMELDREFDKIITDRDLFWLWESSEYQIKYKNMRKEEIDENRLFKNTFITFFCCAALNRVISNTNLIIYIRKNRKLLNNTSLSFIPSVDLANKGTGINIHLEF